MTKLSSFEDAFKLLDQALADQTAPDFRGLVSDELSVFKSGIQAEATELKLMLTGLGTLGAGHASEIFDRVEDHVRENPLLYLSGAALGAIAIGVWLSRSQSRPELRSQSGSKRHSTQKRQAASSGASSGAQLRKARS